MKPSKIASADQSIFLSVKSYEFVMAIVTGGTISTA